MKNRENAFKIVTAETRYVPDSFRVKKVTKNYNYSKSFGSKRNIFIISI